MRKRLALHVLCAFLIAQAALPQGVGQTSVGVTSGGGAGGGVSATGNNDFTGTNTFIDDTTWIIGGTTATKRARFEVDGFTAANDRVFTIPGTTGNDTFVMLGGSQSITGTKTLTGAIIAQSSFLEVGGARATFGGYGARTENTPDQPQLETGTTSNSISLREAADITADMNNGPCGTAACTNPQFIAQDKDSNTTNYQSLGLSGLSGSFRVTLTEATPTSVVSIPVAAEAGVSGELLYTVYATDGLTPQTRSGRVIFNANNDGGTEVCVLGTPEELDNTPTGTLTATITCAVGLSSIVMLTIDATSSLGQSTLEVYGTVILVGSGEALPQ